MDKRKIYIVASIIIGTTLFGFASATDYDAQVSELANSILTQIQNDVPPVETSGIVVANIVDTTNGLLGTMFTKTATSFNLTDATLNSRLNGGILSKNTQESIDYLYEQKLTKFNTPQSFQVDAPLRRDEAAKFFSVFASEVTNKSQDATKNCTFSDILSGHVDLQTNVIDACKMGIFKGNNGKFNPTSSLTNGEALAVLMRILYGPMDETNKDHRAKNYRLKAQSYGLTQGSVLDSMSYLDTPITRGDVARLLEAARFIPTIKLDLGGDITYSLNTQGYTLIR